MAQLKTCSAGLDERGAKEKEQVVSIAFDLKKFINLLGKILALFYYKVGVQIPVICNVSRISSHF